MHKASGLIAFSILLIFIPEIYADTWNVVDAGAVGDGVKDNTAVFQKLLDEAGKAGGGIVTVPAGRFRIDGNLSIPGGVTLEGTFRVPPTNRHDRSPNYNGSVLLAYAGRGSKDGKPFIKLDGNMATLSGFIVQYPEWRQSDVPPVPYPPCVLGRNFDNVAVLNCCFINPYEAVRLERAGRHLIRNVYGYPCWRGLYVDECYDIGRVENCHFWPFGVRYNQDDPFCKWVNVNGVAFEFARTDWQYVLNTFCFGYGAGYKFSQSNAGACNGNFLGIGADSCRRAVLVEQGQLFGILITNGEFVGRWGSDDSVCLEIAQSAKTKVSLSNCSFWGPIDKCVWSRSDDSQFTANGCNFVHWDNDNKGSAAIELEAGKAIVQGNTFGNGDVNVRVGKDVKSAILMGNQAEDGFKVENSAGDKTQLIANEKDPIQWTEQARGHYKINIGSDGDSRYLRNCHGQEPTGPQKGDTSTGRWSGPVSQLVLPVCKSTVYVLTLKVDVPSYANSDDAGLYINGKQIATIKGDTKSIVTQVRSGDKDKLVVEVRCKGWIPAVIHKTGDNRTLGIRLYGLTMKSTEASEKIFDANTGLWLN